MTATALPEREQRRKDISNILSQVATAGLAAMGAFLIFALDKRAPGWFFWLLVFLAVVLLAASIYFGGRGIASLGISRGYFNTQAVLLVFGSVFVMASIFSVRVSGKGELETINTSLESLRKEITELRKDIGNEQSRRMQVEGQLRSIQESLDRSATGEQPANKSLLKNNRSK